jgi:hypothetical protein
MAVQRFQVKLDRTTRRRFLTTAVALNLAFTASTALFILLWSRLETLSPAGRWFTRYIVVQGHLATENVIAAWYSSMLLLCVAALSLLAWFIERRARISLRSGWLVVAAVFATLSLDEIGSLHERIGMIPVANGRALGWIYLLILPILGVAAFMVVFAWTHLRRVRATLVLVLLGTALFLLDPVLENVEMSIIHGAAGASGTGQRVHDVLLVVEEGGLELFGILCFLAGIVLYLVRTGGDVIEWTATSRNATIGAGAVMTFLASGLFASMVLTARLPEGDTGIAANWFPAAAWMLVVFAAAVSARGIARKAIIITALPLSAVFGAGLYVYVGWLASRAAWVAPATGVAAAALALEAVLNAYFFRRSPRSSIASPTLRRPRPNPS